jgi:hypothetical protein
MWPRQFEHVEWRGDAPELQSAASEPSMTMGFAGRTCSLLVIALACVAALSVASHAQQAGTARLPRVLGTITRDPARSAYALPYANTVVSPDSERPGQPHLTMDELLGRVPGRHRMGRERP